jgi:signal transduction histidine kinase
MAVVLLVFAAAGATAAEPKRVLLLQSFGSDIREQEDVFTDYLRKELADQSPVPLEYHEMSLDAARLSEAIQDSAFVEYARELLGNRPLDLVVTLEAPAAQFARRHRQDLFASAPFVFADVEERRFKNETLGAVVSGSYDFPRVVENILRVQPDVTTIAVLLGNSPFEKFWGETIRREVQPFENRVNFVYFNELTFEDIFNRVGRLPPRSAILFFDVVTDAHGFQRQQEGFLPRLHATANAPIYGLFDYQLGRGIVGGPLVSLRELSRRTAEVAARILGGASPNDIKTPTVRPGAPEFDWREVRRWGIAEANLPENSIIRFREPTLWEQYKWYFLAAAAFGVAQSLLIVGLLLNRRRLRRAHVEIKASEERMSLAATAATLRFWNWDIVRDEIWTSGDVTRPKTVNFEQFIGTVHRDDQISVRRSIQKALECDVDFQAEYRIDLRDATTRWIATRGRVERDGNGQPIQLLGVSIDITERRRAEEEARSLSGRLISAQEDERARLAAALHDDITQRLALLSIDAGRAERSLADRGAQQYLSSIRSHLTRLSDDVHSLCYALHPSILRDLGLTEALKAECERFNKVGPIHLDFSVVGIPADPSEAVALCLFRVAQEALRNASRHSYASSIELTLRAVNDELELAIRDDGIGFDPKQKQARPSLGLASMRERLSLVGGTLRIESAPGRGTTVLASAPLTNEAYNEASAGSTGR